MEAVVSDVLEPAHNGLQEPVLHLSSQLCVQWCHYGSLKLTMAW